MEGCHEARPYRPRCEGGEHIQGNETTIREVDRDQRIQCIQGEGFLLVRRTELLKCAIRLLIDGESAEAQAQIIKARCVRNGVLRAGQHFQHVVRDRLVVRILRAILVVIEEDRTDDRATRVARAGHRHIQIHRCAIIGGPCERLLDMIHSSRQVVPSEVLSTCLHVERVPDLDVRSVQQAQIRDRVIRARVDREAPGIATSGLHVHERPRQVVGFGDR